MAISSSTTTQAVDALLKWKNTQSDSSNPQLLPQDDFIYLILTLKKIPQKGGINGVRTNPNKIPLPHPLLSATSFSELCLIVDDRPKSKLTSEIAKKKIKEDGISVTKVIKLSKLKTDYRPFEAKRKLCDSYEMFFADKRVIPLLPKLLGKQFFKKKKLPLPIELSHKNWKEQIERACSSALLFFSTGTCCVIRVAKVSMERDEIIENVTAAIEGAIEFIPKKLGGVRSLHLKFSESVALPLYQSLPDMKLRIEGVKEKNVEQELVEVKESGKKKKAKKERIHEVNHDMDEDEVEDKGGEIENNESEIKPTKKSAKEKKGEKDSDKKKRKGNTVELDTVNTAPSNKKSKKKVERLEEEVMKSEKIEEKKTPKKGKIVEVNHDVDEDEGGEIENNEVKSGKKSGKSGKEKKRKGNVVEEKGVNTTPNDKKAKKKGEKSNGESGKKEKKKGGRSVSRG